MVKPELNASGGEKPPSPKRRAEREQKQIGRKGGIKMASSSVKVPAGVWIIVALNFIAGVLNSCFGAALISSTFTLYGCGLLASGLLIIITAIGLSLMRRWALYLNVAFCVLYILAFLANPTHIPLEIIVLPYLILRRGRFK